MKLDFEIQDGMLLVTRDGTRYVAMHDKYNYLSWISGHGWIPVGYTDENGNAGSKSCDVMAIYGRQLPYNDIFETDGRELLWKRKEEQTTDKKEKTIEELRYECIKDLVSTGMSESDAKCITDAVGGLAALMALFDKH